MKDKYLRETRMVDFSNPAIQKLIQNMKWKEMGEFERIKAIYNYVVEHQIKCTKEIKLNAKRNNVKFHSIQII